MSKFAEIVSMTHGFRMTSNFFSSKICQHVSCFIDKMTKNTTIQTDHRSDTRFKKYNPFIALN